jgi:hypothetical protein
LIFKHQISNENKLRDILNFIKRLIDKRNVDTDVLIQLVKLLRHIETRKVGGLIYVNYKPEQEKLYTLSGPEKLLKIYTNDDKLLEFLFNNYFKVFSNYETQQIYQM